MIKNRLLKNPFMKWPLKILSAVVSFLVILLLLQSLFVPVVPDYVATMVEEYYRLDENSVDVLFLGASQMFCTVDAGRMTDEYHICSYDLGNNSLPMCAIQYYCDEALKTQSPKLIMIETCEIFQKTTQTDVSNLVYKYLPMPLSMNKYRSLNHVLNDNKIRAAEYTLMPFFAFHDRWNTIKAEDIKEKFTTVPLDSGISSRGYYRRDYTQKIDQIAYFSEDIEMQTIPFESQEAILYMAQQCKRQNIQLVFFKSPVTNWTKGDSLSVKEFMSQNDIYFIDLNDRLDEIGINPSTDFFDERHLNTSGAEKTTDYLAALIRDELLNNCAE